MKRKISQQEARRWKKRIEELEARQNCISDSIRGSLPGVNLGFTTYDPDWFRGRLEAAQMLDCAICCRVDGARVYFYAVKPL